MVPPLPSIANVSASYTHRRKEATPGQSFALPGVTLKWTDIAAVGAPVPAEVQQRGGGDFYFLLPCTWRNDNELWKATSAKDGSADFAPFMVKGALQPAFCVWELGVIAHEQQAFDRYLFSSRDDSARQVYAADCYRGAA